MAAGLDWVAENIDLVVKLARRLAHRRRVDWEPIYGYMIDRADAVAATHVNELLPLDEHMRYQLYLYGLKDATKQEVQKGKRRPVRSNTRVQSVEPLDFLAVERVLTIVGGLNELHRSVFVMRAQAELTFPEIADVLGCSRGTARNIYVRALREARDAYRYGGRLP